MNANKFININTMQPKDKDCQYNMLEYKNIEWFELKQHIRKPSSKYVLLDLKN